LALELRASPSPLTFEASQYVKADVSPKRPAVSYEVLNLVDYLVTMKPPQIRAYRFAL